MIDARTFSYLFFSKQINSIADPNAKKVLENGIGYVGICSIIGVVAAISYLVIDFIFDLNKATVVSFSIVVLFYIFATIMVIIGRKCMKEAIIQNNESKNEEIIKSIKNKSRLLTISYTLLLLMIILFANSATI